MFDTTTQQSEQLLIEFESIEIHNHETLNAWITEFKTISFNYLSSYSKKSPEYEAILKSTDVEGILRFYKHNESSKEALGFYPGEKDETRLLKWIVTYKWLLDEMTFDIIYYLENYMIDRDINQITIIAETGSHILNEKTQEEEFIVTRRKEFCCELSNLIYTVNFLELIWDKYCIMIEKYDFLSETDDTQNTLIQTLQEKGIDLSTVKL